MTNTTDITDLTDRALDAFFAAKAGEAVDVNHFTVTERRQLADALGWERTPYVEAWIAGR
jgi:hypothetical protein